MEHSMDGGAPTRRCALVYFTRARGSVYVLLGVISKQMTTIGGRKKANETNRDCCCREVFEETRGLVNFYPYKHGLHSGTIYTYHGCAYYVIEEAYDVLDRLTKEFTQTSSDKPEHNELDQLSLVDINDIVNGRLDCRNELFDFATEALYGLLKPHPARCVRVYDIAHEVKLYVPIGKLPSVVDVLTDEELEVCKLNALTEDAKPPTVYGVTTGFPTVYVVSCTYDR